MRLTTGASLPSLITSPARAPLHKRWQKTTLDCRWNKFRTRRCAASGGVHYAIREHCNAYDFHFFRLNQIPVSPVASINNVSGSGAGIGGGTIGGTIGGGVTPCDGGPPPPLIGGPGKPMPPPEDPGPVKIPEVGGGARGTSPGAKGAPRKSGAPARVSAVAGGAASSSGSTAMTGAAGASARRFPQRVLAMCSPSVITASPF